MSRNIKEIGKELMGKSLNSFHRKTGLTQLEKNNEMQDGILNGILSQVDDAYIEKTEQSNVIHLEGSGDGVVVLDSIEGNTMVNLIKTNMKNFEVVSNDAKNIDVVNLKPSTTYTFVAHLKDVCSTNMWLARFHFNKISDNSELYINVAPNQTYTSNSVVKYSFTTPNNDYIYKRAWALWNSTLPSGEKMSFHNALVLEGDWTDKEVPINLQGLQSSFEEQIEDDKYKIEILSINRGNIIKGATYKDGYYVEIHSGAERTHNDYSCTNYINILPNKKIYVLNTNFNIAFYDKNKNHIKGITTSDTIGSDAKFYITTPINAEYVRFSVPTNGKKYANCFYFHEDGKSEIDAKHNKIKLLLNEPLRAIDNIKDRLCIKDGKLVVERRCGEIVFDGSDDEIWDIILFNFVNHTKAITRNIPNLKGTDNYSLANSYCDKFIQLAESPNFGNDTQEYYAIGASAIEISINNSKLSSPNVNGIKKWLQQNPTKITYELKNPVYEEVLNEHGEPILLEGYENGTVYIDSAIVPTTSVKYTPKMESFKTLKEVNNNNIMLTNDVNDNIIPYMMDVDLMIMEKEMALMSHQYKLRRTGEKDMTSMQKRTQDMLTRLIKGKTLTEQECKTRVVTYLDAGKITDAQADELMLLISEVYA